MPASAGSHFQQLTGWPQRGGTAESGERSSALDKPRFAKDIASLVIVKI
jgi:hypothetical protein